MKEKEELPIKKYKVMKGVSKDKDFVHRETKLMQRLCRLGTIKEIGTMELKEEKKEIETKEEKHTPVTKSKPKVRKKRNVQSKSKN